MLTINKFKTIVDAALAVVRERSADFYGWVNSPVVGEDDVIRHTSGWGDDETTSEVTPREALEIMTRKLDGAYGERFVMSLGTISALIANSYNVRFVQFRSEAGVPFNASGWTVMVIETMPVFHVSPDDLRLADVVDVVEILDDNGTSDVCWKQTNKVGEFAALMAGACQPGLDLVKIAQDASK